MTGEEEAVFAAADLVGRTGATSLQVGYLHDDVPPDQAGWYAHAQYRGARITEEDHPGPVEALEALARRLLAGAECQHCKGTVRLAGEPAVFRAGMMINGTRRSARDAARVPPCEWRRAGPRWVRGCETAEGAA